MDGLICPVTDTTEISEIEEAIAASPKAAATHLRRSLELLSDRERRDYRNSIKESISAVESVVKNLLSVETGTLGKLLTTMEKKGHLPGSLKAALGSLYGYTSDHGGIRHALSEKDDVDLADPKFMLVTCSAFVNYVLAKSQKA